MSSQFLSISFYVRNPPNVSDLIDPLMYAHYKISTSQAKKEYNYARFFSILRSPSTPYLYACIMFKHVEHMRKIAFKIMAKTFGARRKDTKENMYDKYPLKTIVNLLCFEDEEEAREACKHYNITVREDTTSSNDDSGVESESAVEMIFWRHADFKEPVDADKSTHLTLRPRKMMRTIESKLNGATRLAVCRGEVSGEGAALSKPVATKRSSSAALSPSLLKGRQHQQQQQLAEEERRNKERREKEAREELERQRLMKLAEERQRIEEAERRQKEQERIEAEKIRKKFLARQQAAEEAQKKEELLARQHREMELAMKRAEEKRIAAEVAARAEAAEKRRKEEEERVRIVYEKEEARKLAIALEIEQQKKLSFERTEEKRRIRIAREEQERRQKEEARRLYELEIRREQEEEEHRIALEWEKKKDAAKKILAWLRWRKRLRMRRYGVDSTRKSLKRIELTFSLPTMPWKQRCASNSALMSKDALIVQKNSPSQPSPIELFYRLGTVPKQSYNLCTLMIDKLLDIENEIMKVKSSATNLSLDSYGDRCVLLYKLAVIVPQPAEQEEADISEVLRMWIASRLGFNQISTEQRKICNGTELELRCVVVDGSSNQEACESCDAVLFVIPPYSRTSQKKEIDHQSSLLVPSLQWIHNSTPFMVMNFDDGSSFASNVLMEVFGKHEQRHQAASIMAVETTEDNLDAIESALFSCCNTLIEKYAEKLFSRHVQFSTVPLVQKVSVLQLGTKCILDALWNVQIDTKVHPKKMVNSKMLDLCQAALHGLVTALESLGKQVAAGPLSVWPPTEFVEIQDRCGEAVPEYFSDSSWLPINWQSSLMHSNLEALVRELFSGLYNSSCVHTAVVTITKNAPRDVQYRCEVLLWKKQYKKCLETALLWQEKVKNAENMNTQNYMVYVPENKINLVFDQALENVAETVCSVNEMDKSLLALTHDLNSGIHQTDICHREEYSCEEGIYVASPVIKKLESNVEQKHTFSCKRHVDDNGDNFNEMPKDRKAKRRRPIREAKSLSLQQKQSKEFTANLEALLNGEMTLDVNVGDRSLAEILSDCSDIELPRR